VYSYNKEIDMQTSRTIMNDRPEGKSANIQSGSQPKGSSIKWGRSGTGSQGRTASGQSSLSKKCEETVGGKTNMKKFGCR